MYSDIVIDHFSNPRNVGFIEGADGVGEVGNPVCGDLIKIFIRVENNHIEDARFQTFGCGAAVASASMLTEMAKGKSIDEARLITNMHVAEALGGLPPVKMHCSNIAADALQNAIADYEGNSKTASREPLIRKPADAQQG